MHGARHTPIITTGLEQLLTFFKYFLSKSFPYYTGIGWNEIEPFPFVFGILPNISHSTVFVANRVGWNVERIFWSRKIECFTNVFPFLRNHIWWTKVAPLSIPCWANYLIMFCNIHTQYLEVLHFRKIVSVCRFFLLYFSLQDLFLFLHNDYILSAECSPSYPT